MKTIDEIYNEGVQNISGIYCVVCGNTEVTALANTSYRQYPLCYEHTQALGERMRRPATEAHMASTTVRDASGKLVEPISREAMETRKYRAERFNQLLRLAILERNEAAIWELSDLLSMVTTW
jgi:hypothetical protein